MAVGNLGNAVLSGGDLARAHELYQQGLALARSLDDKDLVALWLNNDAEIVADLGDLNQARQMVTEALAIDRASGNLAQTSDDVFRLADISQQQGRTPEARSGNAECMELRKRAGDAIRVTVVQLAVRD